MTGGYLILDSRTLFSLIHKLMASTIRTGTVTSIVAVIILVLFLIDNESNGESIWQYLKLIEDADPSTAPMAFGFCLGRIYALTMLYNLNNRSSIKGGLVITNGGHSEEIGNTMNMTGIRECLRHVGTYCGGLQLIVIHISDVIHTTTFHSESLVRLHTMQCILSLLSLRLMMAYRLTRPHSPIARRPILVLLLNIRERLR